jgi:hypothetical protein
LATTIPINEANEDVGFPPNNAKTPNIKFNPMIKYKMYFAFNRIGIKKKKKLNSVLSPAKKQKKAKNP